MFKVTSEMLRVIKGSVKILTAAVESITSVTRLTDALSLDALSIVMAFFTFTGWGLFTWHRNVQYLIRTGPTDKNVFCFYWFFKIYLTCCLPQFLEINAALIALIFVRTIQCVMRINYENHEPALICNTIQCNLKTGEKNAHSRLMAMK